MAIIVDMPRLSDTMEEGTIAGWLKQVGADVKAGDGLAEIETDKAVMVFESFDKGVLLAILLKVGDTVPLGTPMAILGKAGEDIAAVEAEARAKIAAALGGGSAAPTPAPAPAPAPTPEPAPSPTPAPTPEPAPSPAPTPTPTPADLSAPSDADGTRIPASPLARRIAQQRGLSLAGVQGTGPRGRIVEADLANIAPQRKLSGRLSARVVKDDEVTRVTQMRKTIAKRLVQSKTEAPHYYLTIEVDAGRLVALRTDLNQALELSTPQGEKARRVSYNDLVMRACVLALAKHPAVNSGWEAGAAGAVSPLAAVAAGAVSPLAAVAAGAVSPLAAVAAGAVSPLAAVAAGPVSNPTLRHFGGVHLGFAVALPEGLITPVIRDADQIDIFELSDRGKELAARARDGKLESHDYTGNSFCVSNLGMFGIDHFTAIINAPASCILAVGALVEAAIAKNGVISAGHRLTLTLSCDHRVVDGATGAAFMADLRKVLEAPTALLI